MRTNKRIVSLAQWPWPTRLSRIFTGLDERQTRCQMPDIASCAPEKIEVVIPSLQGILMRPHAAHIFPSFRKAGQTTDDSNAMVQGGF